MFFVKHFVVTGLREPVFFPDIFVPTFYYTLFHMIIPVVTGFYLISALHYDHGISVTVGQLTQFSALTYCVYFIVECAYKQKQKMDGVKPCDIQYLYCNEIMQMLLNPEYAPGTRGKVFMAMLLSAIMTANMFVCVHVIFCENNYTEF